MASHPTRKQIGQVTVAVDQGGYPYWTRINYENGCISLGHEEARDLLYAMQRIVAFLDAKQAGRRAARVWMALTMTNETSAAPRYCACCGGEIAWDGQRVWLMNLPGRGLEFYHTGCDFPPGCAVVVAADGEEMRGDEK